MTGSRLSADVQAYARTFQRDGVVHMPCVLDDNHMTIVEEAFNHKMTNSDEPRQELYPNSGNHILEVRGQSGRTPSQPIKDVLSATPIADIVAGLFESGPVWFHEDQAWLKDARNKRKTARRTPWHQDSTYSPFMGAKYAVIWMSLDSVPLESALEFVRGSHLGPRYNPVAFVPDDDTAPLYPDSAMPRIPDIEKNRKAWDIVSWPVERGDILIFNANTLHGGGATLSGDLRRSLTIRLVGDDVVKKELPQKRAGEMIVKRWDQAFDTLAEGQPYHEGGLYQVHPASNT